MPNSKVCSVNEISEHTIEFKKDYSNEALYYSWLTTLILAIVAVVVFLLFRKRKNREEESHIEGVKIVDKRQVSLQTNVYILSHRNQEWMVIESDMNVSVKTLDNIDLSY